MMFRSSPGLSRTRRTRRNWRFAPDLLTAMAVPWLCPIDPNVGLRTVKRGENDNARNAHSAWWRPMGTVARLSAAGNGDVAAADAFDGVVS